MIVRMACAAGAIVLVLGSGVRCGSAGRETASPDARIYVVRGVFVGSEFDGQGMRVDHEEIPGVMGAMTMSFRVEDPAALEALQPGDKIEFRYVDDGLRSVAREVRKLPSETELKLAAPEKD